jgi:hypothetical protein
MLADRTSVLGQVEALLLKVEVTPADEWRIADEEHRLMVELAGAFGMELPVTASRSPEGAASFLRLARLAVSKDV